MDFTLKYFMGRLVGAQLGDSFSQLLAHQASGAEAPTASWSQC